MSMGIAAPEMSTCSSWLLNICSHSSLITWATPSRKLAQCWRIWSKQDKLLTQPLQCVHTYMPLLHGNWCSVHGSQQNMTQPLQFDHTHHPFTDIAAVLTDLVKQDKLLTPVWSHMPLLHGNRCCADGSGHNKTNSWHSHCSLIAHATFSRKPVHCWRIWSKQDKLLTPVWSHKPLLHGNRCCADGSGQNKTNSWHSHCTLITHTTPSRKLVQC